MSHICWVQTFTPDEISDKKTLKTTRKYANRGGSKENRKAVAMERKAQLQLIFCESDLLQPFTADAMLVVDELYFI